MSRSPSPNSITYEYGSNHCSPYRKPIPDQDILSKLKVQVFEKDQNKRNFNNLMCKYNQLEQELAKITEMKKQHELSLQQLDETTNKDIATLKSKNENLFNDLNEKIAVNKKLYSENNNLFHELETKTAENQNLHNQVCEQEAILRRLNCEKDDLERKINNLKQLKDKQEKQIFDLKNQINCLSSDNESHIATLDEVRQIQDDGRARRAEAEVELGRIEGELRDKLLQMRG